MQNENNKVIFSGIQPSGSLTLGNYLGALKNWAMLQNDYSCYYCIVDMHAITVRQDAKQLQDRCIEVMALLIACGLSPESNTIFFQSHVPAHAELTWVLNCNTYFGELSRMTQFKDKSSTHSENINSGLFTYPVLMAADILLYQTDLVPVGADQKQHLELSRDIAIRFNNAYGETFRVPEAYIPKVGGRIMSLQEPTVKMSKSDSNENAYILLLDPPEKITKKIKRAVTDSGSDIKYDENRPGLRNLLDIYSSCTGKTIADIEQEFEGKGYGALKQNTAEAVVAQLEPIQKEYTRIMQDKAELNRIILKSAEKANTAANRTLKTVYDKIGLAKTVLD